MSKGIGGSYRRNKDGSIKLVERTGWKPTSKPKAVKGAGKSKAKTEK